MVGLNGYRVEAELSSSKTEKAHTRGMDHKSSCQ